MRMIILPRAAAGVSTARMISRERFAFDLEKFSQWEVCIRLLSFSAALTPPSLHTLYEEAFIMDDEERNLASSSIFSPSLNTVTPVTSHDSQWPSSNTSLIASDRELAPRRPKRHTRLSAGTGKGIPLRWY